MAETMNMMEVSVDRFIKLVREELEDENYDPMLGLGKSGVGKTMSIYELTEELGIGFCELRLVTLTEIDLLGIPTIENGRTTYAANALLPDVARDGEEGILVLDEITSASSTIRAAAYQLLDSKRALGNYKLPPKWKVIALGNGIDDGGVFQGMENAFLSRAVCYRIEPNLDSWKKWAINKGVNPSIIAYLSFDPSKLHDMNVDDIASIFPCPRSWTALSKKLNAREKRAGRVLDTADVELYAAGAIGVEAASSFSAFYSYNNQTVSVEDILNGKVSAEKACSLPSEVIHLLLQSLASECRKILIDGKLEVDYSEECTNKIIAITKWIVGLSKVRVDYSLIILNDIANIPEFTDFVLLSSAIESCNDFMEFAAEHSALG